MYKRSQKFRFLAQETELDMEASAKMHRVARGKVRQATVLDVTPDSLVGIEFRSIAGKPLCNNFRVLRQVFSDIAAPIVNVAAVPDNGELTWNMSFELPKE